MMKTSAAVGIMSEIPGMEAYGLIAEWALALGSMVTGIFGWSKPNNASVADHIVRRTA